MSRDPNRLDPDDFRAWVRIFRDLAIVILGTFMLVFETAFADSPNPLIVGAGLVALGLPPALRLDEAVRARNGNGK